MATQLGLRELKKQRTRQLIADTAWRLFAERGFDEVPVAEIAREAEVSEATVFNYFPTKEDLVFSRMEAFEQELLSALRDRPEGESIVQASAASRSSRAGFSARTTRPPPRACGRPRACSPAARHCRCVSATSSSASPARWRHSSPRSRGWPTTTWSRGWWPMR